MSFDRYYKLYIALEDRFQTLFNIYIQFFKEYGAKIIPQMVLTADDIVVKDTIPKNYQKAFTDCLQSIKDILTQNNMILDAHPFVLHCDKFKDNLYFNFRIVETNPSKTLYFDTSDNEGLSFDFSFHSNDNTYNDTTKGAISAEFHLRVVTLADELMTIYNEARGVYGAIIDEHKGIK